MNCFNEVLSEVTEEKKRIQLFRTVQYFQYSLWAELLASSKSYTPTLIQENSDKINYTERLSPSRVFRSTTFSAQLADN